MLYSAGFVNKAQSRLTQLSQLLDYADAAQHVFSSKSDGAAERRALYLSTSTISSSSPLLALPVTPHVTLPADIACDMIRLQGGLPLRSSTEKPNTYSYT